MSTVYSGTSYPSSTVYNRAMNPRLVIITDIKSKYSTMASGRYTLQQEPPLYSDDVPLHPLNTTGLEVGYTDNIVTVHDVTYRQVTACCMLCSILNYLCCPFLGIPALIFAILGTEAEKRGELEAAKSHAFHLKIFNIIYAVGCTICLVITGVVCIIFVCLLIARRITFSSYG